MFPDLLIARKVGDGFRFDVLEPHDPSLADNFEKLTGALQVNGVPGVGDDRELSSRDANAHLPGNSDKLAIESAGHQQNRHAHLVQPVPIRWLRTLTLAAETIGQPNGAISKPNVALELENLSR